MATGDSAMDTGTTIRNEKRKLLKKEKRKQLRKEIALREKEKEEEEAQLHDTEEQRKLKQLEQEELDRMERDRREFEERERKFIEALELKRKREQEEYEQEQERKKLAVESRAKQVEEENSKEMDEGSDWEFVEEGPAEIIWQGNEIIVKKKRVRVPKKNLEQQNKKEGVVRPISNPLAPQSEAFEDYKSAKELLDSVAQQVPNFGTEQDKAHCPFHLKTGACRFGTRCSRVHFYPDKSCTLLIKNMYGGPGLLWEQDEGLEHTDEEIERSFEEFYEDVHTEFLKFGELVNFKVCRNGSPHLRGYVYVHYKSLESAVLAYNSTNGRYFAGKQIICEFINLTRWRVAICGEYMKSRLKRCSRGSVCNFIHCFRNPGGDYEWADWDQPPPRYWITKMAALFGYGDEYDKQLDEVNPDKTRSSAKSIHMDADRRHFRSRSRELESRHTRSYDDNDHRKPKGRLSGHIREGRENSVDRDRNEEKMRGKDSHYIRGKSPSVYSDDDHTDRDSRKKNHEGYNAHKKGHRQSGRHSEDRCSESDSDRDSLAKDRREKYTEEHRSRRSRPHSKGKSSGSDSGRERSIKDGRERYHKHHKHGRKSAKHRDNDLDSCSSDSHGDTTVKSGDSVDKYVDDYYYRQRKGSSNPKTVSKKTTDLSEHTRGSHRDRNGKRESSKHKKREKSRHKSERRSSKHHKKDHVESNVTLSDKEEDSERTDKHRKESSWDQYMADDQVGTTEGEKHDGEKHGRFDEGNGHLRSRENSVELEIENEQACRRAALEKLQEKQLHKQLSPKCSSCYVEEGSVTASKVHEEQTDSKAEPRKRRRI